jgi:hypothetical protein
MDPDLYTGPGSRFHVLGSGPYFKYCFSPVMYWIRIYVLCLGSDFINIIIKLLQLTTKNKVQYVFKHT